MAKKSKKSINKPLSLLFAVTCYVIEVSVRISAFIQVNFITEEKDVTLSVENRIVLINFPWLVSNPVLNTKATQPPSGARRFTLCTK
jgi:hypothetical protein